VLLSYLPLFTVALTQLKVGPDGAQLKISGACPLQKDKSLVPGI
jgi:hypothetical protein